jgi:hypothetical protein
VETHHLSEYWTETCPFEVSRQKIKQGINERSKQSFLYAADTEYLLERSHSRALMNTLPNLQHFVDLSLSELPCRRGKRSRALEEHILISHYSVMSNPYFTRQPGIMPHLLK